MLMQALGSWMMCACEYVRGLQRLQPASANYRVRVISNNLLASLPAASKQVS